MAEREGFEPPVVLPTSVFKTGALNRSAISPFVEEPRFSRRKGRIFCRIAKINVCFFVKKMCNGCMSLFVNGLK